LLAEARIQGSVEREHGEFARPDREQVADDGRRSERAFSRLFPLRS